jgi:hypothetical protein
MLQWDDDIIIDTSGELRSLRLVDGWYVVGEGMCIPCEDVEDTERMLASLKGEKHESRVE